MTTVAAPLAVPVFKPKVRGLVRGSEPARDNAMHVWTPPQSPLRIECARELLRDLPRRGDEEDSGGVLYGIRNATITRVISVKPRAGLISLGIFSARARGEVFMTEEDLVRLERLDSLGAIALVIAGNIGGFFVRESDGSIQTIQSYQEFPIRGPRQRITPAAKITKVLKQHLPASCATVAMVLLGCLLLPRSSPPALTIQQQDGQLRIAFSPSAVSPGARLQILDGEEHRSIAISRALTSVVYVPVTRDVRVSIVR